MTFKNINYKSLKIKKTYVKLNQKISDALKSLTNSQFKICIVVDKKNYFKGSYGHSPGTLGPHVNHKIYLRVI